MPRYIKFRTGLDSCLNIPCKKNVKIIIFVLKREQKWQGNLLQGIKNCSGTARFVVQGTWTTSLSTSDLDP